MLTLKVEKRDSKIKPKALRAEGNIPAVFYGPKEESTPVTISEREFKAAWKKVGESTVLSLEGVGDPKEALIHDVTVHPVTEEPLHADFYVFEEDKILTVKVPLEFVGESPAVKDLGGGCSCC